MKHYSEDRMRSSAFAIRKELGRVIEREEAVSPEEFLKAQRRAYQKDKSTSQTQRPDRVAELTDLICELG